jgi:RNA 2',3'-cyclic 3'-phosphodiesterase
MRCFVGIQLPETVRTALSRACSEVRAADATWQSEKWVPAENLHMTLAFLGNVSGEQGDALRRALGDRLEGVRGFELPFAHLRPMPSVRKTRMLWAVWGDPERACADLALQVAAAAASCGVEVENRTFKAHATLVRTRRPLAAGEPVVAALDAAESRVPPFVSVQSATFFSSTLTRTGARYEALESWNFLT